MADLDADGVINPRTEILEESRYYPYGLKQEIYNRQSMSLPVWLQWRGVARSVWAASNDLSDDGAGGRVLGADRPEGGADAGVLSPTPVWGVTRSVTQTPTGTLYRYWRSSGSPAIIGGTGNVAAQWAAGDLEGGLRGGWRGIGNIAEAWFTGAAGGALVGLGIGAGLTVPAIATGLKVVGGLAATAQAASTLRGVGEGGVYRRLGRFPQ